MQLTSEMAKMRSDKKMTYRDIAEHMGVTSSAVRRAFKAASCDPQHRRIGVTISERNLLLETDLETRAIETLRAMFAEIKPGEYIKDFDLRKLCGCSGDQSSWRSVSQAAEFAPNAMEIGSRSNPALYWGHPRSVASMIERNKARKPLWAKETGAAQ
jgi:hypothetical protein